MGGGGAGGLGGEDVTVVMKGLHAHEHTCQCTQVDAWPMSQCWLQMLAKKASGEPPMSIPANMSLLEESL